MSPAIVDLSIRAFALLSVTWIAVSLMRRTSASLRALVWTLSLAGVLALPLVSRVAPRWHLEILPAHDIVLASEAPAASVQPKPSTLSSELIVEGVSRPRDETRAEAALDAPAPSPAAPIAVAPVPAPQPVSIPIDWNEIALFISALVTAFLLARVAASHTRLSLVVSDAADADGDWADLTDEVRASLRIRRRVSIRVSDAVNVPAIVGLLRPVLLLPNESEDWDAELRRAVVVHELAHVARFDALAQIVGQVACALYWFIPLTWHGAHRAAALRERASDDEVLRAGIRATSYADRLISLARGAGGVDTQVATLAMARPSRMRERVVAILDPVAPREALTMRKTTLAVVLCGGFLVCAAAIDPVEITAMKQDAVASSGVQLPPPAPPVPSVPPLPPAPPATSAPATAPEALAADAPAPATPEPPAAPAPPAPAMAAEPPVAPAPPAPSMAPEPPLARVAQTPAPPAPPAPSTPPAPPAPSVLSRDVTVQTADGPCGRYEPDSNSIHDDNGYRRWTMKMSGGNCTLELRAEGRIEFTPDFTDIRSLGRNGFFRLDVTENGTRRQLELEERNGSLARTWRVDGREQTYDDAARRWFAGFLIQLDRRTAIGVDVRLPHMLRTGGVDAVLRETAQIPSDWARGQYYTKLTKAATLSPADAARVLRQAAMLTKSDYYANGLIQAYAVYGLSGADERNAVTAMIDGMDSDYYRAESIKTLVGRGRPGAAEIDFLLNQIPRMKSDHYQVDVLKRVLANRNLTADQQASLARAASSVASDYYAAEFLQAIAATGQMAPTVRRAYLDAVRNIEGSHYAAEALGTFMRRQPLGENDVDGVIQLTSSLDNGHYRGIVIDALLEVDAVGERALLGVIDAARAMTDHYESAVLRKVVRHRAATDRVRTAALDAASGLSSHYRNVVRDAAGR